MSESISIHPQLSPLTPSDIKLWSYKSPIKLQGEFITLYSYNEIYSNELYSASIIDPLMSQYFPSSYPHFFTSPSHVHEFYTQRIENNQIPLVVINNITKKVVGSFNLIDIQINNRSLEIGGVWLEPSVRRTSIALECVYLILLYSFEYLKCYKVIWKTDSRNIGSSKLAIKAEGKYEGRFNSHMIMRDGYRRDSLFYGWLDYQWNEAKYKILNKLENGTAIRLDNMNKVEDKTESKTDINKVEEKPESKTDQL